MVYFTLKLNSNESTFEYSFSQEFLDKKYEIALIKLNGNLEINKKININHTNNKFYYLVIELIKIIIQLKKRRL
jgi:C4-dicarboxylate transporter